MYGYTGKIARVDLTKQQVGIINTEDYKEWNGGHGLGAAIFFDLVKDKTIGAFDPGNVLVIAPGLFSGTLVPAACRTEMVGIAAQQYPYEWFSRSNVGGRFANMLKYAGFDGIVLEGAAETPVWINIIDGDVKIEDASNLWGLDAFETQKVVFKRVTGSAGWPNDWTVLESGGRTTQQPAVLAIGPCGENRGRVGIVLTDTGNAFGQCGFGGVWGSKNLKAISVLGSGSVEVANPSALMEARLWAVKNYGVDYENPKLHPWLLPETSHFAGHVNPTWHAFDAQARPSGCYGCHMNCRPRTSTGLGNEGMCSEPYVYSSWDKKEHGSYTEATGIATDLCQRLGVNSYEIGGAISYTKALYDQGILGPGKQIESSIPFDKIGKLEFFVAFLRAVAYREDIGDVLAEGLTRAGLTWGKIDESAEKGLDNPYGPNNYRLWGQGKHRDIRLDTYWAYGTLVGAREINCHDLDIALHRVGGHTMPAGETPLVPAKQIADWFAELPPYYDPEMANFSTDNIYSAHMAKTPAWIMHYSRFWKQSCGLCDAAYADIVNPYAPNNRGLTPEAEVKFYSAVTGKDLSFEDSMEIGRKIYNMDKAIWTLQGRHRDMEKFPELVYTVTREGRRRVSGYPNCYYMVTKENGVWDWRDIAHKTADKDKVEEWKSHFYELEGWDISTGWQTRATLEELGLKYVADELEAAGKLP